MAQQGESFFEITNIRAVISENKKQIKAYKAEMQEAVARYLDAVRFLASEEFIIKNITVYRNPRLASIVQKADSTRLTERTGKLNWMLKEKFARNPKKFWINFGKTLAKLQTSTLNLQVKYIPKIKSKTGSDDFQGTIRLHVKSLPGRITSTGNTGEQVLKSDGTVEKRFLSGNKMPRETKKTVEMRFIMHEIRGRRKFIDPAAKMALKKLEYNINKDVGRIWVK